MRSKSSKTEAPADQLPQHVTVGRIVRPHGVRGEVVVEVLSDNPRRFSPGTEMDGVDTTGQRRRLTVEASAPGAKGTRVRFEGVADRDGAEGLRGLTLEIARGRVPAASGGRHYYFELVGCLCVDTDGAELGRVDDLVESGGGLLLRIDRGGGKGLLIPYAESYLAAVDVCARRIVCRLPEGFIETCTFRS